MIQSIQTQTINLLDTLVKTLEQYDDIQNRPKVWAASPPKNQSSEEAESSEAREEQENEGENENEPVDAPPSEKIKQLSFELIDIGLYEGKKGLDYLKSTQLYERTDQYVHFEDQFERAK